MRKRISNATRGKSSKHLIKPLLVPEHHVLFNSPYIPTRVDFKEFYDTSAAGSHLSKNTHGSPFVVKKLRPHFKWRAGKKLAGIPRKNIVPAQVVERNLPFSKARYTSQEDRTDPLNDIIYSCFSNNDSKMAKNKRRIAVKPLSKRYRARQNATMQNFAGEEMNLSSLHESIRKNLSNYISVISSNKYKVPFRVT